jgi:hypothetical protein
MADIGTPTMIESTLMIFGPGGIGKSPIDSLVRADAVRIDPYRLRSSGPRDQNDVFYAHPKLREELTGAFIALGDALERISTNPSVDWFVKANATTFDVRGEWQCLLLGGLSAKYAKAEVYAPALPALLQRPEIRNVFGALTMVILNPVSPLRALGNDFATLKSATAENCLKRGDSPKSIEKRTNSIDEEAEAWMRILEAGGTEYAQWEFAEYTYRGNETETKLAARSRLVAGNPAIAKFLKSEDDIRRS